MMKKICWILWFHMFLWLSPVYADITVNVPAEVQVHTPVITLGELASINGDDAERIRILQHLKLGDAPMPGNTMVLSRELLGMRLAADGTDLSGINWQIPDAITISAQAQTITRQQLIDTAVSQIQQMSGLPAGNADLSITLTSNPQDVQITPGPVNITADLPYGLRYSTPTTVNVSISQDGQLVDKEILKFDVKLFQNVVVTTRPLGMKEIITPDSLRYERMDIGHLTPGYYTDMNKLIGLAVRRPLAPETCLTESMVAKPVLIKRGAAIYIIARVGDLEVKTSGQALQDGSEGQIIRVQNTASGKIVSGKVLNEASVRVLTYRMP